MSDTTRLALPRIDAAQAQKHVTHNEALSLLDALVHLSVISRSGAAPVAPVEGARTLVTADAAGAFAGQAGKIASFDDGAWRFLVPRKGWRVYVEAENRMFVYDGAAWTALQVDLTDLQNMRYLGVGAAADADNPVLAKVNVATFTASRIASGGTGDLRIKLDKERTSSVLSQLYQTNWSGRAETGLIGDDKYRIKVSADGASWKEAMNVDPASGRVYFPNGASDLVAAASMTAGTPAAYLLSAPLRGPLPDGALFWMVPHAPNATALNVDPTLQIDQIDAAPLPLRNFDGTTLAQGALETGKAMLVRKSNGFYCVQSVRSNAGFTNLLEDGGRHGATPEPILPIVTAYTAPGYFNNTNGASRANYGMARYGAAMPTAIPDLLNKIRSPSAQAGAIEFFVTQVTAGAGVLQGVNVQNTNFYPTLNVVRVVGRGLTLSAYVRVMSGSLVFASSDNVTRVLIDGVAHDITANAPERVFTAAQGWKHIQMWIAQPNGASTCLWPTFAAPGCVFLIALPALIAGFETLPWDIGPVTSARVWR